MNYTKITEELENASLFDLYRLYYILSDEIENPKRIRTVKNCLRKGQVISFYNAKYNKLCDAEIVKMNKINCVVRDLSDGTLWTTPYAAINFDNVDVTINTNQKYGLKKHQIAIGEVLTFLDKENEQRHGKVLRLNQKSVTLLVGDAKWRVSYSLLGKCTDIDGNVIDKNLVIDYNMQ